MCAECTQGDDGLVSLFTREWIEILEGRFRNRVSIVSLFTREWIEIMVENVGLMGVQCLPLYEGVD